MPPSEPLPIDAYWQENSFNFIKPEEFEALGIDSKDIPPGTYPAHKHPDYLPSRLGGNAYGFGLFELYGRLSSEDIKILQSDIPEDPEKARRFFEAINRIHKKLGLLIRFSNQGHPYYLLPEHLVSSSLTIIGNKSDEIGKVIGFHRKKYLKESHTIGLVTHADDLIINDLSVRFKEHQFVIIDSLEKLRSVTNVMDLVILTRDVYEIVFMGNFMPHMAGMISKKDLENFASYFIKKIYNLLKSEGELFIIAEKYALKTQQVIGVTFKTEPEQKNFLLFSHIFKTKKRYQFKGRSVQVNVFDFQRYLSSPYVEKEVIDRLLGEKPIENMKLQEINDLPYLNLPIDDEFAYDQLKRWSRLLNVFFNKVLLKPVIPESLKQEWQKRFSAAGYTPEHMLIYLGQKRPLDTTLENLKERVRESGLSGCPLPLLAGYRNSFEYVLTTLEVLKRIKAGSFAGIPDIFLERLKQPLDNKKRRYPALNDVLKLMSKINRLKRIRSYLNPGMIEGAGTPVLENLETLSLSGFSPGELKEIFLIVVGHTPMGRILTGKMNERTLKPISDLACNYDPLQALNLLRYCRLMSLAETVASRRSDINQEQLAELFDLYESMVKVVTNREMDWDRLLDEKISSLGGIHNKIVRKILKLMNHFQFLDNWSELSLKGDMEKESLADYDEERLTKIGSIIKLVNFIEQLEDSFLKEDPLQLPIFYRKFLNIEFHGTARLFERMDSELVFLLLWVAVNVVQGDIINFNPILAHVEPKEEEGYIKRVEEEARNIKVKYLDLSTLRHFSSQLNESQTSFIMGTGFQLRINPSTQALDVDYIDMDENIRELEILGEKFMGRRISDIPIKVLKALERVFANLESFYQNHLRLISGKDIKLKLPARQIEWHRRVRDLRGRLKISLRKIIFKPESIYTDLDRLHKLCPSLLGFVLPEFMALNEVKLPGRVYIDEPLIEHILISIRKIQALISHDREGFQNIRRLRKLAQREFGPLDTGIIGLNESHIETLEAILEELRKDKPLFDALIKSFIFRDLGFIPQFREKYKNEISPVDHAQAGACFLEKERISTRYNTTKKAHQHLVFLIRHHDFLHHMLRGEFSFYATQEILDLGNQHLLDAFFITSFMMFSAMREDLILEDLATMLFQIRSVCQRIIGGETSIEGHLEEVFARRGHMFCALEAYRSEGGVEGTPPAKYLESFKWQASEKESYILAGRMIYAMERLFRLRGIRYVEFYDLARLIVKVPLKFIYKKRNYFGVGYAKFERELFEALRIYNGLEVLFEPVRHFVLERLVEDEVRIYGFEKVGGYLNYENLIKLLLIALLGSKRFKKEGRPVCLDFLGLADQIERRYEAVNDALNQISVEKIWENGSYLGHFFKARTGILFKKQETYRVLSVSFVDKINISQKLTHMETISDVEHLKNYFHHSLRSLRKSPFFTDDYELKLERAYDGRLKDIITLMLEQANRQMELLHDFKEIHNLVTDLMDRSLDIGFSDEQRHRLTDLYELRKDSLKRDKLQEIDGFLGTIQDEDELRGYWDSIKWYLLNNRVYLGKEFETLIARKFDESMVALRAI